MYNLDCLNDAHKFASQKEEKAFINTNYIWEINHISWLQISARAWHTFVARISKSFRCHVTSNYTRCEQLSARKHNLEEQQNTTMNWRQYYKLYLRESTCFLTSNPCKVLARISKMWDVNSYLLIVVVVVLFSSYYS